MGGVRFPLAPCLALITALLAACGGSALAPGESSTTGFSGAVELRPQASASGCCTLIAHAGGSIDGNPYTNSREALLLSIEAGFRLIELDFSRTRDGAWFLTHDWKYWAERTGFAGELPPSAAEVAALRSSFSSGGAEMTLAGAYTSLSLDELLELLAAHPEITVVTDTKDDATALALIEELRPRPLSAHFVFQVYSLAGLQRAARAIPARQLSLTTYRLDWFSPTAFDAPFLAALQAYPQLYSFTLPLRAALDEAKMGRIKSSLRVPVWTHGPPSRINSRNLQTQLARRGVNGLFVD